MAKKPSNEISKLIAVEGLDGSGKSTQIRLLKRWLELEGYKVFFTEWNSSDLVKKATRKGKKKKLRTPTTFSLIHCTDFAAVTVGEIGAMDQGKGRGGQQFFLFPFPGGFLDQIRGIPTR